MKNLFCLSILLFLFHFSRADDGTFYSVGGNIFPMQETDIQLKKQEIIFQYVTDKNGYMHVQVSFHFFNPTEAKDLLVGFVSPGVDSLAHDSDIYSPPVIWNFSVAVNGVMLPFELHQVDTVKNKKAWASIGKYYNGYYVYLFKAHFNKGWNEVNHVYDFKGDKSNSYKNSFSYYFRTGKTWANHQIDEINISISGLNNQLVYLPHSFSKSPNSFYNWKITGIGKLQSVAEWVPENKPVYSDDFIYCRDASISSNIVNFMPDEDFFITVLDDCSFFNFYEPPDTGDKMLKKLREFPIGFTEYRILNDSNDVKKDISAFTNDDLQFDINYIYSRAGYPFKKEELKTFYNKMVWYIPDYNTTDYKKNLDNSERILLDLLLEEQKKRKL